MSQQKSPTKQTTRSKKRPAAATTTSKSKAATPMSEASSNSSRSSGPGPMDGFAAPSRDAPLRGVSRDYVTPTHGPVSGGTKASGKPRTGGKASGRARSADDVSGLDGGGGGLSSQGGGGYGRKPSFDPLEETDLSRAAKKRFGDKVGPVIHAHLHLMGVDTEDDLRYADVAKLMSTAETSGLKQVQIAKLHDWVVQAQQVNEDLEVRFATALLALLRGDKSLSAANLERWANKSATNLAREFTVLKAEAETARASRAGMADDDDDHGSTAEPSAARLAKARGLLSGATTPLSALSRSPSEQEQMAREMDPNGVGPEGGKKKTIQKPPGFCMANPTAGYRMAWDFALIMPCLAYLTIVMPFRMCLGNEPLPDSPVFYLEMAMDFVFILDIAVNFRTGFEDDTTGLIVYEYARVAKNYMRSWFLLDVASGIPFGILDMAAFRKIAFVKVLKSSRILKAVKLLRFLKLSRLIKGLGIMNRIDPDVVDRIEDFLAEGTTRTVLRISKIMLVMMITAHFMACAWILAARMNGSMHEDEPSWISQDKVVLDADYTMTEGGSPIVMDIYLAAFYYSFTTMTTVGYGDVTPKNMTERIFAICLECLGGFMYAYVISSLTSIVTMEDANAKHTRERLDAVASYINKMELPKDLGRRVRRYFRARKAEAMDEGTILMDLSPALRGEVSTFLVEGGLLADVVLFKQMNSVYWPRILPILRPCPLMRAEIVCREGEDTLEAFIVVDGELLGTTSFGSANGGDGGDEDDDDKSDVSSFRSKRLESMDDLNDNAVGGPTADRRPIGPNDNTSGPGGGGGAPVQVRRRRIGVGHMVNPLCLLKVWEKSVEKVVAAERTESYAITAETFYNAFAADEHMFKKLQDFVVNTQFEMDKESPEATVPGREHGVPVYVLNEAESKVREEAYMLQLAERRKEVHKHKKGALKKAIALGTLNRRPMNLGTVPEGDDYAGGQEGAPGAQARL